MHHYLYQITNRINGKIYIGIHSCEGEFLDSDYYGSGTAIKVAVEKYDKCLFLRQVLAERSTREEVANLERQIVNEAFVANSQTYNLTTGGYGWGLLGEEARKKISDARKGWVPSEETRRRMSESHIGSSLLKGTRRRMSESHLKRRSSQFEYLWRHDANDIEEIATRSELRLKYDLKSDGVKAIVDGTAKTHRGWKCLGPSENPYF